MKSNWKGNDLAEEKSSSAAPVRPPIMQTNLTMQALS